MHSYNLRLLRNPRRYAGNVLDALRTEPPSLLVIAAAPESIIDVITSTYRKAATKPTVSHLGDCGAAEVLDDFREALAAAIGVSPAMHPSAAREEVDTRDRSQTVLAIPGVWPVMRAGQRQIHAQFGLFVENLEDGYWYTRDRAGHADSLVKRYRRIGRRLEHDADFAQDGSAIPKHKAQIGATVSLDEMRGV